MRINRYRNQSIFTRDRHVERIADGEDYGFGIRVIVDGTWGFSASSVVTADEMVRVARKAVEIARANRKINADPIRLAPTEIYNTSWATPARKNPFDVPIQTKVELLLQISDAALKVPGATFVNGVMQFMNERKSFCLDRRLAHRTIDHSVIPGL